VEVREPDDISRAGVCTGVSRRSQATSTSYPPPGTDLPTHGPRTYPDDFSGVKSAASRRPWLPVTLANLAHTAEASDRKLIDENGLRCVI